MKELIERRILGAVEFVHGITGARVRDGLAVSAAGLDLRRNASGLHVMWRATGLEDYAAAFDDPPQPARRPYEVTVLDRQGRFLPQAVSFVLPRLLPGQQATPPADADNVLVPLRVQLWPSAALPLQPGWAVLRLKVALEGSADDTGLVNVWVEAVPAVDGVATQHALTDRQGEALVVVQGAPPIQAGAGATLTTEFRATLRLVLDPEFVRTAGAAAAPPVPDPQRIEQHAEAHALGLREVTDIEVSLSAGRSRRHVERVVWP